MDRILDVMEKLNSVTLKLHRDNVYLSQVHFCSDTVVRYMLSLASKLSSEAAIIENSELESEVVKLQMDKKIIREEKGR